MKEMVSVVAIPLTTIWLQIWKLVHLLPPTDWPSPGIKRVGNKPSGWSFFSGATVGLECTSVSEDIDHVRCELYLSVHLKLRVHLGTVRPLLLPVFDVASLLFFLSGIKYSNSAYSWGNLVLYLTFGSSRQWVLHRKGIVGWDLVFGVYAGGTRIKRDAEKDLVGEVWCLPCLWESDSCLWKMDWIEMNPSGHGSGSLYLVNKAWSEVKWKLLSRVQLCDPMDLIRSMEFSKPEYWSGYPFPSPGDLPSPGIEPRSPTLQADSSPAEPQGKPKNTGVGSLSLLQLIFPPQESNWDLLHCRWILYQLNYEGSPPRAFALM